MNTTIQNTTKYKNSPLGLIPVDWEVKTLGDFGSFTKGKGITKEQLSETGFNCIRYGEIYTTHDYIIKKFTSFIDESVALISKEIKKGDILFAGSGETIEEIGKAVAYLGDEKAFAGGDVIILNTNNINVECLSYALEIDVVKKQKRVLGQGNSVVHIYSKDLSKLKLPIPPLPEQKAIADCLSTWDKAIEKQNALIAQKELSKKALGQKLLTGKLRIKKFENEKWIELKADKIFRNNTDKSHNGELEILSASQERGIVSRSSNNIDIKYDENSLVSYKKVEVGDYVISLRSFQGGIEYSEYEGIVSPAYTILKEIVPISKVFYKVYFKTETFINRLNTIIYGIRDGKQISFKDFATLKIPYPSIDEQNAIANVLHCADAELQLLKSKLSQLKEQKKGMMQVLLTGKKRLKY